MKSAGVLSDRTAKSESLDFLQCNLIYGFNGSGKSTISRLFASLQKGERAERLPEDCSFEMERDDGKRYAWPKSLTGMEKAACVFNADFIDENLQWATGLAKPIFYIGAEQAQLAAQMRAKEGQIHAAKALVANEKKLHQTGKRPLPRTRRSGQKTYQSVCGRVDESMKQPSSLATTRIWRLIRLPS